MPPHGLGGPLWADAPAFDLADHARVTGGPAPGGEAALLRVTEQLRRSLDRSRPLWEMWFLTGGTMLYSSASLGAGRRPVGAAAADHGTFATALITAG